MKIAGKEMDWKDWAIVGIAGTAISLYLPILVYGALNYTEVKGWIAILLSVLCLVIAIFMWQIWNAKNGMQW